MKRLYVVLASTLALTSVQVANAAGNKGEVSKEDAQAAALKAVPGEVLGWSKEIENNAPEWQFDIKSSNGSIREVEVNAKTGKVRSGKKIEIEETGNGVNRKTENAADLSAWKTKTTRESSEKEAIRRYPGKVVQTEAEIDDGKPEYEFLIVSDKGKKIVEVDAATGKVRGEHAYLEGNSI